MKSFTCPEPRLLGLLRELAQVQSRESVRNEYWPMLRLLGWISTISVIVGLLWFTTIEASAWFRVVTGLLIAMLGLLSGLRLGTHSASEYIKDVHRLNKVLAEQNKDLEKANAILLKELGAETKSPARSRSA
jgi:hypothetical protein